MEKKANYSVSIFIKKSKESLKMFRRSKIIILSIFIFFVQTSIASNYYISSTGNDQNSGTNENQAWQTLEKVNSFIPSPGDHILFKRGDAWTGTITVKASGTDGNPITYGAYGSGDKPKIYGSEVVTDWTKHSGNIYKATLTNSVTQIFVDDTRMQLARYPNEGYFNIDAVQSTLQFQSNDLTSKPSSYYKGAMFVGQLVQWVLQEQTVASSSGNTLTLSSVSPYPLLLDKNFFLSNKLEFLDVPGQWFYDTATKTIYLWTPNGDSPANYEIRGTVITNGVFMQDRHYITIKDLNILQSGKYGIRSIDSPNLIVDNNTIKDAELDGIDMNNGTNSIISNNTISGSSHSGIDAHGANTEIRSNTIYNILIHGQIGIEGGWGGYGIRSNATSGGVIANNDVYNTGNNGIHFGYGPFLVEYNRVRLPNRVIEDGGGIYTGNTPIDGTIIRYNIVSEFNGGDYTTNSAVNGIYLDDYAKGVTVEYNTVFNGSNGIYLHNNEGCIVRNNTIFDCALSLYNHGEVAQSSIKNNILCTKDRNASFLWYRNTFQRLIKQSTSKGSYDYNTYISHYSATDVFSSYLDISAWKTDTEQDANSTFDMSPLETDETEELFYNDSKQIKTINLGSIVYRDINGKSVSGIFTLEPFTSKILIKTKTKVEIANQSPVIQSQSFEIYANKQINESIGQVIATDPDKEQTLRYSIIQGNEGNLFNIQQSNGEIFTNTAIELTEDVSIDMVVKVTDNASIPLSASNSITINIIGKDYDISPPIINAFTIPTTAESLVIPITTFVVSDNNGVTGYNLTETPNAPLVDDSGWTSTLPATYTFTQSGTKTLYAWAKDAAGNISNVHNSSITISLPDLTPTYSEYLFEEQSGTTIIDSKDTNNGTIFNEVLRVEGVIQEGMEFTGSGHVNLGQCFGGNVQNEVTLSAWIKPDATLGGYQGIIMHGGPIDDTYALYINLDLKSISFKTSGTSSSWLSVDSIGNLWDGKWHFLATTYNGTEKVIYLDSKVLISIDTYGAIESGKGYNLLIGAGRDTASPNLLYKGLIDEVRIHNYALTNTTISELHSRVDTLAPTITSFIIPSTSKSLIIPVSTLNATDNKVVTGYCLTETPNAPQAEDSGWKSSVPSSYTFSESGIKIIYAWAKDAAGNISNFLSASVVVDLPDLSATFTEFLFEESLGKTVIDSQGPNDGTIFNEELRINGIKGKGLEFTGLGYINLGQCFGDNVQNEVTLSAWVKPDAPLGGYQGIIMHGGPIDDTYALYINPYLKSISFKTRGTLSSWVSINNVDELWDGNWHLLTTTYNGSQKIIYLDSEPIITIDATGKIDSGEGYNLLIGAGSDQESPTLLYEGLIDEVRIYNYALTSSEISELYRLVDIFTIEDVTICEGTSYQGWTSAGQYTRILQSVKGADSIVTTNLSLNPIYNISEEISIPEGEDYLGWIETGEYQRNLTTVYGCDSVVTTYLSVIAPIYTFEDIFICDGSSYQGWVSPGQYQRVLQNMSGYDSIITTNLWINPVYNIIENIRINEGEVYNGWFEPGQYERNLTSITGCDSIVVTNLNVLNHFTTIWESENGQNHMNISISEAYIEGEKLQIDDEIAIYDGSLCVGTAKLKAALNPYDINSYAQIITSQNDGNNNGFISGNNISFKIWDASEKIEKDVSNINYKRDCIDWITTGKFVAGSTSVVEIGIVKEQQTQTQSISLKKGWNIFSSYLVPTNSNMESVQGELRTNGQLLKVQDEVGNTYEEWNVLSQWINNIGELQETEGYKIKVNSSCVLEITGQAIQLPLNIEVKKGWNIISFPFNKSIDAIQIIQPLIDQGILEKIQDERGNSIENWGQLGWLNSVGNFNAGEGYKVKVSSNGVLQINEMIQKSSSLELYEIETSFFNVSYEGNGNDHMNINIVKIDETDLQVGDEIAAFDGNVCVGAVKLNETHISKGIVSVIASVSEENMANGFVEDDLIQLRVWRAGSNEETIQQQVALEGEMVYKRNASVFIQFINQKSTGINAFMLNKIEMYPNPATDYVTISFYELPEKGAKIIVTDITGKKIISREVQSVQEVLDLKSQVEGLYFIKIIIGDSCEVKKLIVR